MPPSVLDAILNMASNTWLLTVAFNSLYSPKALHSQFCILFTGQQLHAVDVVKAIEGHRPTFQNVNKIFIRKTEIFI